MSKQHPALTPMRIAELSELAKRIDRDEAEEIRAMGREIFAETESKKRFDASTDSDDQRDAKAQ